MTTTYRDDPAWADVPKVPQDDGPSPIVSISYSSRFTDVMDCFRGVLQTSEFSARALALTLDVIDANPANYTVWYFRRRCLEALGSDLHEELRFTQQMALEHPKNYQIWHHRREICARLGDGSDEKRFTRAAIAGDSKNYHAWAHRQWAIKTFGLWEDELEAVDELLDEDVRNNSAWNHRWFVLEHTTPLAAADREREAQYAFDRIERAVHNESPWNYLRGLVAGFETHFAPTLVPKLRETLEKTPDCIFAAALLVELYAKGDGSDTAIASAVELVDKLMSETDRVRKPYWQLRKKMLLAKK